jgi:hypothetical protein
MIEKPVARFSCIFPKKWAFCTPGLHPGSGLENRVTVILYQIGQANKQFALLIPVLNQTEPSRRRGVYSLIAWR